MMPDKEKRVELINKLILKIADTDRQFFRHKDMVSKMILKKGRIYFIDKYTQSCMYAYNYRHLKEVTEGGTLKALILDFSEWIRTGKYTNGKNGYGGLCCPHWGYTDEGMQEIRELAVEIGYLKESDIL